MANPERLTALIAVYRGLDPVREVARICPLLAEAAVLVDREVEPKKWAALRGLYGRFATDLAPESALAAYLEALTVWNPEADREAWVGCHASVGLLYLRLHPLGSTEADQAIVHLELAVNDQQTLAATLGQLYQHKISGDPGLNWQQRFRYFQLALSHTSPAEQPQEWASYQNELGIAYSHEPSGDYTQGIEKRIACHMSAVQALAQSPQNPGWIENGLNLSEAYLFRVLGGRSAGRNLAEYNLNKSKRYILWRVLPSAGSQCPFHFGSSGDHGLPGAGRE